MDEFLFQLGASVVIDVSQESGEVIGQARYKNIQNLYLIRYKCADGRAVEDWWGEDALTEIS
jgi:hypothetical protein